ncbi:hypothetical protein EDD15DRAFT_2362606 [Pisolithus albus]|nr:hypothetical protein EDD15DRAFT_2362606 [Pisolithus albus]
MSPFIALYSDSDCSHSRLACTHVVQGVATRFFVTDPTEVVEAGITMSSPSPAATIERFVPLVKDIDDEVSLCLGPPSVPLPPALQQSAAQIKPVDHKAMKCLCLGPPFLPLSLALQRSAAQIKPVDYEAMKCLCLGPPSVPLPPALQRSAAQIKPVDHEAMKCLCPGPPFLPLPPALQRSAAQIKPVDYEAMKSNTRSMQARLAEACMEIGDTDNPDFSLNGGLDYSDGDQGTIALPPSDEDDDELDDAPPVYSKYFQPFVHSRPRSHRCHDTCPRVQRNRHAHQAWQAQLPTLVDRYLAWKHNGSGELAGDHVFHVDVIGVFQYERHVNVIQKADESANEALLRVGLLGCSPSQPRIAISLQAMVKVLCALQNIMYSQHLRSQFSAAFDIYLNILRFVHTLLKRALGHDGPAWKLRGACPACAFEQPDEPPLSPARLHSMDGNQSAKRLDGSGSADSRLFHSDYFIPHAEVERFKDDVRDRPGEAAREKRVTTCTDNWTAAKAVEENQIQVFEQTGIFLMACRHGFVECIAEMKRSGELAKYGLAAVNRLLNICGQDQAVGHDVGCASKKTIASSSLGKEAQEKRLKVVVNAFHGFAHNRMCQLENHPLYQIGFGNEDLETCERIFSSSNNTAPLIRHASEFHWKQFLDLHFSQWDSDKYLELTGRFLYNNYKQALCIIQTYSAELERFKRSKDITDNDFESWHREELEYLKRCAGESDATSIAAQYVELLEKLNFAEATYGSVTQVPYLTYTPAEFTSTAGLNESARQGTNAVNAKYASALRKYQLQLNVVANFEHQHNIIDRWTPLHREYINAREYTKHRVFIRTVEELEGLVVQRMFELSKANLAKMGYKMHKHISKANSRRSAAIRAALERYNKLAPRQRPPRPKLDYAEVIGYSVLGEFSLLKHSRYEVLEKPWALPDNREMMMKYFKLQRSQEEITRLNVEIRRLQAWLDFDGEKMKVAAQAFRDSGSSELASEMESMYAERVRVNDFHRTQLQKIYEMPGYTGCRPIGDQPRVTGDGTGDEDEEDGVDDKDDGEAFRLGDTLDRMPLY